ncbi:hypothetical protein HanPSC8_Chr04g0156911 [Helianthus annuus]|nr:hypothetical protein HanPSC8_Chr04g0156911 [Helianthus annuus]
MNAAKQNSSVGRSYQRAGLRGPSWRMEEYEMVEGFASGLAVNEWICCKLQMMNRPLAPILVLLCKR